jgi:serine/threonine-protein kinase
MPLSAGTRLGPYEIQSALGAGGMGEVYRARDTRLDRSVALKVLAPEIAADPAARARFEREARAVAALDHPHICGLHDVGEADGTHYLVMPLEGQTLAARLEKGQLPLDQALTVATQIADALDKAHRQGIVHRDLKPANIMLTKAGAKLLDFGLAKLRPPGGPISMSGIEETRSGTAQGAILGTVLYMAPEQVEGRDADARADIWALGAVIYEMVTGTRPFGGDSAASVIGAILKDEPPSISTRQPLAPPLLDRVVGRCLAKDPADRWQSATDVHHALQWIREGVHDRHDSKRERTGARGRTALLVATAAAILAAGMMAPGWISHLREAPPGASRLSILPPPNAAFAAPPASVVSAQFALSPDGRFVAYVAETRGGRPQLWVRPVDSLQARPLAGTEDATYPFWSPDGRSLGFFSRGMLRTIELAGGPPRTLTEAPLDTRGGTWNRDA